MRGTSSSPRWILASCRQAGSVVKEEEFRDGQRGRFLVAYLEDEAVGCGGLRRLDDETAELKRFYVSPAARSRGIGKRLLAELEDAARNFSYRRIRLDTRKEGVALQLFASSGYGEIDDYNRNPLADVWLEKSLQADPTHHESEEER